MSQFRVVHVVSRLNVGGVAQQVLTILGGIIGEEFECLLVTGKVGDKEGDMLDYVSTEIVIYHIPEMGRSIHLLSDIKALWKLFWYLKRTRPDILHTHAAKAGALGRIAGLLARIPIRVHSYHGNVFRGYFSPMVSFMVVLIERVLGWISTAIVLPCESQCNEISETYRIVPKKKARIVGYGIAVDQYKKIPTRKEARRALELGEDSLIVGAVGRMAPIKNNALLIESFARLIRDPETKPPLTIGIYGAWGSGKTFLMTRIMERLRGLGPTDEQTASVDDRSKKRRRSEIRFSDVAIVHFNAWEYEASEKQWAGMV